MVFPYLHLSDLEVQELKGRRTYVAGFLDPTLEERTDLYDIFVNGERNAIKRTPAYTMMV